jgi:hypothetical protein
MNDLDHLVYATPDLERAIDDLEHRLGVRAAYGGRHPGRGTRNALIALSDFSYLEIIGPDPDQGGIVSAHWFGIDALTAPRLVTWAAKHWDIERLAAEATRSGLSLGRVASGSRQTPDGVTLRWQFTNPDALIEDGLVPFFIDWGRSPHPAASAPRGPALLSLRAEHPEPERIERALSAVGVTLPISRASRPGLIATLGTEWGEVELR